MQLTKTLEKEILKNYDRWLDSYLNGDVATYDSYFDDAYHFIGSTNNEEFLSREDTTNFFKKTAEQFAGKTDSRNEIKTVELFDNLVFITHAFDAWFLNGKDWVYYGRFRFSSVMQKKNKDWKFIYQHFSTTDSKADHGDTIGFDKVNLENQELREAIKRRTFELEEKNRALEIEGALERIRAQAVAMKQSSDLLEIVVSMRNEFTKLGHEAHYFWHMMWLPEKYEKAMTSGDGTKIGFVMELPRHMHGDIPLLATWEKSKKPTVVYAMDVEAAINYIDKMVYLGNFKNIDPQAPTHDDIKHIGGLTFVMARTTHGEIGYSLPGIVKKPPTKDIDILIQFAGAFDLAHRRFLDLQKAEQQAREVQIELALEKVRSRTMAMQRSDELRDTALILFQQVEELGINSFACGFNIWDKDKKFATAWMAGKDRLQPPFRTNSSEDVYLLFREADKRGDALFVLEQEGKSLEDHYKYLISIPEVKALAKAGLSFPTFQIIHCAYFNEGYLMFITHEPVPDAHDIFIRFAKVFEQTYTRFLDLQKAEAQARESEIELALERVRARTMSMQHSDELQEASFLLDEQVRALGIKTWGCAFNIYGENESTEWFGNEAGVLHTYTVPREGVFKEYYQQGQKGKSLVIKEFSGDACVEHYEYMSSLPVIGDVLKTLKETNNGFPTYQIDHVAFYKYGYLLFITREDVPESHNIFKRFAKVFEQTYTRFLDLQKAEAQAREAQIEMALERVRSRTMAMQNSEELGDVILEVLKKLQDLGISMEQRATAIFTFESGNKDYEQWVASPEYNSILSFNTPYFDHPVQNDIWNARQNETEFYAKSYSVEEKNSLFNYIFNLPGLKNMPQAEKTKALQFKYYNISIAFRKNAALVVVSHSGTPLTQAGNSIIQRLSKVFEQTYTRFLDLQKAEAQAREAQIEAALERVRSRSISMHRSEELSQVVLLLDEELMGLGINVHGTQILTNFDNPEKNVTVWFGMMGQDYLERFHVPYFDHPIREIFHKAWKKDVDFYTEQYSKTDKNKFFRLLFKNSDFRKINKERQKFIYNSPGFTRASVLFKNSILIFQRYNLSEFLEEETAIFKRFGKVFEQAYTRFIDLQKAEAQAKEAKIEASLERIRSRSMAMQKSSELLEAGELLWNEITKLGIECFTSGYVLMNENEDIGWNYTPNPSTGKILDQAIGIPHQQTPPMRKILAGWKKEEPLSVIELTRKQTIAHQTFVAEKGVNFPFSAKELVEISPKEIVIHAFNFKQGYLMIIGGEKLANPQIEVMLRFTKVFQQTYTRFLDLKKAEAQARESQIEAALEKVRSRSLAMHNSEELQEVITTVLQQLNGLNLAIDSASVILPSENKKNHTAWISSFDFEYSTGFNIPYGLNSLVSNDIDKTLHNGNTSYSKLYSNEDKNAFYNELFKYSDFKSIPQERKDLLLNIDIYGMSISVCENSGIITLSYLGKILNQEEIATLQRFAMVFEQAYTRFLDLQKAEAQAREAQIENALEKVRSRSLAMHKPDELQEVVAVVAEKLQELGVIYDAGGVILCTYFTDNKDVVHWIAVDDFSTSGRYYVPYFDNPIFSEAWDSKSRGDAYFSKEFPVEVKDDFFKQAFEYSDYKHFPEDYKQHVLQAPKHGLSAAWSKNSAILIPTLTGVMPSENDAEIMKRFAKVFEQAYIRFMDLQKAEERARETQINIALERVRSRTLAMQNSEELAETSMVVFQQLVELGIAPNRLFIGIIKAEEASIEAWATNENGSKIASQFTLLASKNKSIKKMITGWKQNKKSLVIDMKGKELQDYFQYLNKEMNIPFIHGLEQKRRVQTIAYFSEGLIGMAAPDELSAESIHLLERFASVFNLTYTRFKDLKVAEAQAKKAEEDLINLQLAKKSAEKALSELQQTQKQLIQSEKMASLGELTAGIAHEIQNPLNFVNNFSEVSKELLDEMLEEIENGDMEEVRAIMTDVIQNLEKINHHGKRADGIVKGMLQHSRASGNNKEPTNINALTDEYFRLAYHGLRAKDKSFNAQLETDYDDNIKSIDVIPQDMGRVILNLITNAFYAVDEQSRIAIDEKQSNLESKNFKPTVLVRTKKAKDTIEISVTDNGNGIPNHIIDKIFQPFFTTKPTGKGTGLGLSMSYDIIKAHDGELKVETTENKGSIFTITLPIT